MFISSNNMQGNRICINLMQCTELLIEQGEAIPADEASSLLYRGAKEDIGESKYYSRVCATIGGCRYSLYQGYELQCHEYLQRLLKILHSKDLYMEVEHPDLDILP
jgi:hypothetical protein